MASGNILTYDIPPPQDGSATERAAWRAHGMKLIAQVGGEGRRRRERGVLIWIRIWISNGYSPRHTGSLSKYLSSRRPPPGGVC